MLSLKALLREAKARGKPTAAETASPPAAIPAAPAVFARPAAPGAERVCCYTSSLADAVAATAPAACGADAEGDNAADSGDAAPFTPDALQLLPGEPGRCWFARAFVSPAEERALLALACAAPARKWVSLSSRELQVWDGSSHGTALPPWLADLAARILAAGVAMPLVAGGAAAVAPADTADAAGPEPSSSPSFEVPHGTELPTLSPATPCACLLSPCACAADHVLLNAYACGQGIDAHKDGPRYAPRVAILSLAAPVTLAFWRDVAASKGGAAGALASVSLPARSLLVFESSLYWECLHGIDRADADTVHQHTRNAEMLGMAPGDVVERGAMRYSLTFRRATPGVGDPSRG